MITQEKVEQKIRELVPELIEHVEENGITTDFLPGGFTRQSSELTGRSYVAEYPIHLEHVLMALSDERPDLDCFEMVFNGYDMIITWFEKQMTYDLTKPFSQQSPTLYQFLADVLL